jgi:hypothetical protein
MKPKLLLLLLLFSCRLLGQTYPVTSINISLPASPDASISNWGSASSLLAISAVGRSVNGRVDDRLLDSRILVLVRSGSGKVCGAFSPATAPASNFTTVSKAWAGQSAVGLLGQDCTLPAGEYELCVRFYGQGAAGPAPLSEETCRPFTIRSAAQADYLAPQPILPADGASFAAGNLQKALNFRWTPVIPKPAGPVTYRLRVWQLMEGQTGAQAQRVNTPVLTADVDGSTQAGFANRAAGLCAPGPCSYVWNVQALDRNGKPIGSNNGTGESFRFTVSPPSPQPPPSCSGIILNQTATCRGPLPGTTTVSYGLVPSFINNGQPIVSWSVTSADVVLINGGSSVPSLAGSPALAPAGFTLGGMMLFTSPASGTVSFIYTFVLADNSICTQTASVTIGLCPGVPGNPCPCGQWGPLAYTYFADGVFPGGTPQNLQATLVNDTASITVAQGSRIWPQSGYVCGVSAILCTPSYLVDLYKVGVAAPILSSTTSPAANFGGVVETPFNTCGDYLLIIRPTCGVGTIHTPCPPAYIKIHVDCSNPCNCGQISNTTIRVGSGPLVQTACNNLQTPVHMQPTDPISIGASLSCSPVSPTCVGTLSADIFNGAGVLIAQNVPLPLTNYVLPGQNNCGLLKVVVKGKCNNVSCQSCTLYLQVDCPPPPCVCAWQGASVKVGSGPLTTRACGAAAPIAVASGQSILVQAAGLACGANCTSSVTAEVRDAAGNVLLSNASLPLTYTPPATLCGILKIVLRGSCGGTQCSDCILTFEVACCVCAPWGKYGYVNNGVVMPAITNTPQQTLVIGQGVPITLTGSQACGPNNCGTGTGSVSVLRPNGTAYGTPVTGLTINFPFQNIATPCGIYKLIFEKTCGGQVCRDTINVNIQCCSCGPWTGVRYIKNGVQVATDCNTTVLIDIADNLTGVSASHGPCIPSGPNCTGSDSTFVYTDAGVLVTKVPGLTAPNFPKQCRGYKIVFRQRCGANVCDCILNIQVDCCGGRKIKIIRNWQGPSSWFIPSACVVPGTYNHALFAALPAGMVVSYKILIGSTVTVNSSYTVGTTYPSTFTVPQYTCTAPNFTVIYSWGAPNVCRDTLRGNICEPPCCTYINLAPANQQFQYYSNGTLSFTTKFIQTPASIIFNKVKVQILELTVEGNAQPAANFVYINKFTPGTPSLTGLVNSALTGTNINASQGNAIWFTGPFTGGTPFQLKCEIKNLVGGGPVKLRLRYTFYRNPNNGCPESICEKEVQINL